MSELLDQDPTASDSLASDDRRLPELKRETILPVPDRSRMVAVAAMCSLAGIAVGFGLSMFALQMTEVASSPMRRCPHRLEGAVAGPALPFLGITFTDAHDRIGPHEDVGAAITVVHRGTPAEAAGLSRGDVVIAYDGDLVDDADELYRRVRSDRVGGRPVLSVLRDGETLHVVPTLDVLTSWR